MLITVVVMLIKFVRSYDASHFQFSFTQFNMRLVKLIDGIYTSLSRETSTLRFTNLAAMVMYRSIKSIYTRSTVSGTEDVLEDAKDWMQLGTR